MARVTLLARAGDILSSGLSRDARLERLTKLLVPSLASWCAIDLVDERGAVVRQIAEPGGFPFAPDAPHGSAIVVRTGEPELLPRVTDDMLFAAARGDQERLAELRQLGLTSALTVPLTAREGVLGAITLLSTIRAYGREELELACELARRTASALEMERSAERYRMLFEASPLPMWVYDAETLAFLAVNDAAVRHYGYSREEFLGMTLHEIRPPEDVPQLLVNVQGDGGPGSPAPGTWRHLTKDGRVIEVEITAGRIEFDGRRAALVLANDVSERMRLERRLSEAEKMEAVGRLAGGVAHDFNNLLTVIGGYAEILLQQESGRDELEEIARAAEQASQLTRQLLAFSRRQVLHPRVLDLNEIVAGMEGMLQRIIGDDICVAVKLADELSPVEADRAQIERVILNLAANARDAMPAGGALTIETADVMLDAGHGDVPAGPHVLLAVSDTGIGMDEDVRRHLFEPFYTTKPSGQGTGLGLATVFGVVKQSGGGIYVYSEPGRGTTFKIYLPAHAGAQPEPEIDGAGGAAARGSETIMVVEDDAGVRELVRLMLEANGYEVLTVEDAAEATRVCAERPDRVDLLLTDVVMPGVNGRALAERLGALAPEMRVLFMSGYSDEAVHRHGQIIATAAFLEKPFTERALARKVREVLDAPEGAVEGLRRSSSGA
jgi:two-component system cell cycle sensor histidine kinase/response regulator CckA